MTSQRPPSSMGRPPSRSGSAAPGAGRPPTAVRPPPTAIRVPTAMVPGTSGYPGMRGGIPSPGVLAAPIKVTDRPVTQQGLSGMKTGIKGPQRQVLDKSYYLGLLRSKINELTTETSKLHKEIDNYNQENSVYLCYEKRAEDLAAEIKDLQGQLADHNMLVDKLNTNTEMEEIISDYSILKAQNDSEAQSIDNIFTERREREEQIKAIEEEIKKERQIADRVVQSMPTAKQEKYFSMAATNEQLLQELTVLQEKQDNLLTRVEDYEEELSHSQIKQEVVRLHEMLSVMETKRDAMEEEQKSMCSPKEEREKLFQQVKEDNQEIASMERQLAEIRERTRQTVEEIQHLEQNSEAVQGECQQKFKELKRKEEEINQFIESFDEAKAEELQKQRQTQESIILLLEHCSRNTLRLRQVDAVTASELKNMQEVLVSKETDVVQSESTARGLTAGVLCPESRRLQQDLEKVQQLDGKITSELSGLQEQVSSMESELHTYRDLDALKLTGEDRKKKLLEERALLSQRRDSFTQLLEEINSKYKDLKTKLQENETHTQLANLEKKWQHLEKNNFVMKEFIASKTRESDFALVAKNVSQQLADYNSMLIKSLQNKS
ncbi:intraflagellar transport protein 74 homolog isoform X1 [Oryzias latipes]|uniref:intraflagellar transport protein 74 homolog isoform X1 n=1 Tax=Oryzias latipes TaxID=8090 RepID=UPI0009D9AA6A|nr:intraflagellar transport protein 74 homolog isoform X1 [Oryzias latipes]XP_023806074.1 intraflagellar transport protein 74 homolog isoform X1 [Oryzias latipes]